MTLLEMVVRMLVLVLVLALALVLVLVVLVLVSGLRGRATAVRAVRAV
ncbi:hypothetical protein [Streptomyces sp. gCLA4]|nr:hypothetical protein [Streptomyces sp. gCLA4]